MALEPEEVKRFRSFAERYVIERAALFREGQELEDAWECVSAAKTAYKMVARQAGEFFPETQAAGVQSSAGALGATAAPPPQQPWNSPGVQQLTPSQQRAMDVLNAESRARRNPVTGKPCGPLPDGAFPNLSRSSARTRWLQLKRRIMDTFTQNGGKL